MLQVLTHKILFGNPPNVFFLQKNQGHYVSSMAKFTVPSEFSFCTTPPPQMTNGRLLSRGHARVGHGPIDPSFGMTLAL